MTTQALRVLPNVGTFGAGFWTYRNGRLSLETHWGRCGANAGDRGGGGYPRDGGVGGRRGESGCLDVKSVLLLGQEILSSMDRGQHHRGWHQWGHATWVH